MAKKTLLITTFVLLLICSNLLGDARYIQITACTYEGPVFNDGPEGCKIYFNTLNNGYVYIVKYDEFVNPPYVYDIAYITFDETDYFAEWGVDDSLYFTDIEVGELDPDLQEVVPLDDEEWSDDELNQVWGKGYLHGIYPSQLWYVDGSDIIQESSATIEFYGMGNPPWFDYEYRTTYLSASGCNWVSFPVLDPDWADPVEHVLAPILDEQVYVKHEKDWI
ncbi:MAG: hypothetical protein ISS28_04970, partial [Candidatus Cloacimonetes bacterium]|nr:hypothetical protein [Candidatus Cloacimonadota bacterium]